MLANIFLHLAFDDWMSRQHPQAPFERYADDIVVHCKSEEHAESVLMSIKERLAKCKLEAHPLKTKRLFVVLSG
jgi:retron-type reverse transcriptase